MIADLLQRLRALLSRRRWERELDEEMRFHVERDVVARVRAGADPNEARREALLAFGGVDRYKEETFDASGVRPLDDLAADLRFAVRALRRNWGFTATVLIVLALAIGAATAVFSLVYSVLVAELPYPHADRLVRVFQQNSPTNRWTISMVDYQAIRDQRSFDAFGVARWGAAALSGAGEPEQIRVGRVTPGFFGALGTSVAAGRLLEPGDEAYGAPPVVVISAALALSGMGIFGVMSYLVRRQRREIGVRMALGAEPRDVTRMILARGMRYVAAGTLVGLGLAMMAGRWLGSLLYGVEPHDPGTIVQIIAVLLAAALLACLLPGIRASRIRPIDAIAEE